MVCVRLHILHNVCQVETHVESAISFRHGEHKCCQLPGQAAAMQAGVQGAK